MLMGLESKGAKASPIIIISPHSKLQTKLDPQIRSQNQIAYPFLELRIKNRSQGELDNHH
jgi:hypothetical protein